VSSYLDPRPTPTSMEEVFRAMRLALPSLGPASLLVLVAHVDLETGGGTKMRNFSIGGVKATPGGEHSWTFYSTREVLSTARADELLLKAARRTDGKPGLDAEVEREVPNPLGPGHEPMLVVRFHPSSRVACFRAYETLQAAVDNHVDFLRTKYRGAWPHVLTPDPAAYADALGRGGYYTAPRQRYVSDLVARYARLAKESASWSAG